MLMLAIALYLLLAARARPKLVQYVSLPLFFSYIIRPTNIVPIVLLSIYILLQYRKYFTRYLSWGLVIVLPFIFFNYSVYGSLLSPYYQGDRLDNDFYATALAMAGNLISPSRGLFIFMPIFIFSIVGIIIKCKYKQVERLDYFLIGIIVLHWLVISSFGHWWAGWSFGPRYFSDMVPYFVYFLIPVLVWLWKQRGMRKLAFSTVLGLFVFASFFIQLRGVTSQEVWEWNSVPSNVDSMESFSNNRLWDWGDMQYLRGL